MGRMNNEKIPRERIIGNSREFKGIHGDSLGIQRFWSKALVLLRKYKENTLAGH
mgnify:CR=1 FL=1